MRPWTRGSLQATRPPLQPSFFLHHVEATTNLRDVVLEPTVALAGWRKAEPTLLVEENVTAVVQVDGKVRDRLEVSAKISGDELEKLARASAAVTRAVGDREIVNVIVRAPRLVNIATKG